MARQETTERNVFLAEGTGLPDQVHALKRTPVVAGSVEIFDEEGIDWKEVEPWPPPIRPTRSTNSTRLPARCTSATARTGATQAPAARSSRALNATGAGRGATRSEGHKSEIQSLMRHSYAGI